MKQKYTLLFSIFLQIFLFANFAAAVQTQIQNYSDNVIAKITANLPDGQNSLAPSTNIRLDFTVYKADETDVCPFGQNLFHSVIHFSNGNPADKTGIQFKNSGAGGSVSYSFNSGASGQKNAYQGLFYCNSSQINESVLDTQRKLWENANPTRLWYTKSFAMITSSGNSKTYGCKAINGIYACATSPDAASIAACQTKTEINSCFCGKTEEQTKTQCGTTSTTTPPSSTLPTDKLINPIPTEGLLDTFLGITKGFLAGLAIWAVIAIIFAGFRMVIAAGNEEAITQAKKAITWAILGLVVALLSFSIVAIVQNIIGFDTEKFDPRGIPSGYNSKENGKI